jgi:hypothetical protein
VPGGFSEAAASGLFFADAPLCLLLLALIRGATRVESTLSGFPSDTNVKYSLKYPCAAREAVSLPGDVPLLIFVDV